MARPTRPQTRNLADRMDAHEPQRPRLRQAAAVLGVLPLLVLVGGQGAFATGGGGSPSPAPSGGNAGGGNASCPSDLTAFTIEEEDIAAGEFGSGGFTVTLSDVQESSFDFAASTDVDTLIVKGGSDSARVTEPNDDRGTGTAPENPSSGGLHGLSNITFCYSPVASSPSPSATESETASPSPTATETETASPSPTATETETASPSPSATETETASPSPTATETETASPSPSSSVDPDGDVVCPPGTTAFKIDSQDLDSAEAGDSFTSTDEQLTITLTKIDERTFSFTSDAPVVAVIVKGGPAKNYIFTGPTLGQDDLTAAINPHNGELYGLSNLTFCYFPGDTLASPSPTPTETETASPSPTPTETETASPSPSSSVDPDGDVVCPPGTTAFKIDSQDLESTEAGDSFTSTDEQLTITLTKIDERTFSFTSDAPVVAVIVKGGPAKNYIFTGPTLGQDDLTAEINPHNGELYGLSNLTFCYFPGDTLASPSPTPTETETASPSPTATETETASPSPSSSVDPDGDVVCPPGTTAFKIDSQDLDSAEAGDSFTSTDEQLTITLTKIDERTFSFTSDAPVVAVIVKGGPAKNYIFTGPTLGQDDLTAAINPHNDQLYGLSNLTFCYFPGDTLASPSPTPTETETASPSPTPTATETASMSPSPSPTATETASPSPSPTETETAGPSPSPSETASPSTTPTSSVTPTPGSSVLPTQVSTPTPSSTESEVPDETATPGPVGSPIVGGVDQGASGPLPSPTAGAGGGGAQLPSSTPAPEATALPGGAQAPGTGSGSGSGSGPSSTPDQPGALPFTGAPALGLLTAAVVLLAAGATASQLGRRRQETAAS